MKISYKISRQQRGAAAVEFAIIAMLLFILLFGIIEFGRLFYVFNSVQELTRSAAREAVVRWVDEMDDVNEVQDLVLFGGTSLPAGLEITANNISIDYLKENGDSITNQLLDSRPSPANPAENISACLNPAGPTKCIALVRVSIINATYAPMVGLFSGVEITAFPFSTDKPFKVDLQVPIPASTVTMPAESLGYRS